MAAERTNIIITGAGGLIGPALAARLLNEPQYHLVLTDIVDPIVPKGVKYPDHVKCLKGDITEPSFVSTLVEAAQPLGAIFIFHGIMSAGSEANYDLSVKVNVESVRLLVEHLRKTNPGVRVIYSSSQAVYGQPLPAKVTDNVTPTPEGTYGAHKLTSEIYINEMNRRGFIDAFILRFPTVVVRPGKPSPAASAFLSGMIREPMNGQECVIPLVDRSFRSFICAPSTMTENLVRVLHLDGKVLPPHIRHINFPGLSASTQELMDGLAKYGGEDKLKFLKEETNPAHERILRSWPQDFDNSTAVRLGLKVDTKAEDLVKEYVDSLKQ
ncbi:putative nucleoside-diphosphate-sugar epimerase [Thozetella sp. PMI_491]|nr:putative nucleoside-diphosphate-sugar epimerase [Thozetella sp. PMI_491]